MIGAIFDVRFGEDFTDRRREIEAVAGAGRGDDDIRRAGQPVDDEIAVGRDRVEAGLGRGRPW